MGICSCHTVAFQPAKRTWMVIPAVVKFYLESGEIFSKSQP